MRRIKAHAYAHTLTMARIILFSLANIIVPCGMPFGLVDHDPDSQLDDRQ